MSWRREDPNGGGGAGGTGRAVRDDEPRPRACRRTTGIVDRIIADALTADDRAHAETCLDCGPVVARSVRFETELRQAARGFVVEELPRGILDAGLAGGLGRVEGGRSARSFAPGVAGIAAALVIVILAATNTIAPGNPSPGPSVPAESSFTSTLSSFRSSDDITADLQRLKYECGPGHDLASPRLTPAPSDPELLICGTPKEDSTKMAALVATENEAGDVVEVMLKGDLVGTTLTATATLAEAFGKLTFVAIADPVAAPQAGDWVAGELPTLQVLPAGDDTETVIGGIRLTLSRDARGSYLLYLTPVPPG